MAELTPLDTMKKFRYFIDKSISRKSLQHDFFDKLLQRDQCKNKPIKKIIQALSNHKTAESNTLPSVSALSLFGDSH